MDTQTRLRPDPASRVIAAPSRIVVGIDGSAAGQAALGWAVEEADATGAELVICHAYRPDPIVRPVLGGHVVSVGERQARRRLEAALHTARRTLGARRVHGELRWGDPASELVDAAAGARMLVLGSGGYFGQTARLFGSVALRVAGSADCPAVVVRPLLTSSHGPFAGHVVVGVDGTEAGRAALGVGFGYAAAHGLPLAAVHVAAEWPGDFWTDERTLETHFAEEPQAQALLATEVEPFHREIPDVPVKRAVYGGDPVPGLLRAAGRVALLVVGDRRRDTVRRLVLGSVSQGVVGHASCPVAVVHS